MAITYGEISFTEEPREIRVVTGEDVILPCHIRGVPAEERKNSGRVKIDVNSHAVGMPVAQPLDFKIDFARNPISGSAALFLVIIGKLIFTAIFEIQNHVKNS